MSEDVGNALAILEQAMSIEQEGREFYLKAVQTTQDDKRRETFTTLADDEQKHYDLIKRQHDALTHDSKWIESPEVKPVEINLEQPLFPGRREDFEKAITSKSTDWDALNFGLDIEIKSYGLYQKAALETSDPLARQILEFLTSEEKGHFNMLMMRYDSLFGPVAWQA